VVGWIDLTGDAAGQLAELDAAEPSRLVGIRHLAHIDPDPQWLARTDLKAGLARLGERGLSFDLVVRSWQLPLATAVAGDHPEVRFVADHLGGVAEAPDFEAWAGHLRELARHPNTWAKVSGLAALVPGRPDTVRRAVDVALEAFGPS